MKTPLSCGVFHFKIQDRFSGQNRHSHFLSKNILGEFCAAEGGKAPNALDPQTPPHNGFLRVQTIFSFVKNN